MGNFVSWEVGDLPEAAGLDDDDDGGDDDCEGALLADAAAAGVEEDNGLPLDVAVSEPAGDDDGFEEENAVEAELSDGVGPSLDETSLFDESWVGMLEIDVCEDCEVCEDGMGEDET